MPVHVSDPYADSFQSAYAPNRNASFLTMSRTSTTRVVLAVHTRKASTHRLIPALVGKPFEQSLRLGDLKKYKILPAPFCRFGTEGPGPR